MLQINMSFVKQSNNKQVTWHFQRVVVQKIRFAMENAFDTLLCIDLKTPTEAGALNECKIMKHIHYPQLCRLRDYCDYLLMSSNIYTTYYTTYSTQNQLQHGSKNKDKTISHRYKWMQFTITVSRWKCCYMLRNVITLKFLSVFAVVLVFSPVWMSFKYF